MLFCLLMMGMTATVCHMLRQRKRPLPKVVKIGCRTVSRPAAVPSGSSLGVRTGALTDRNWERVDIRRNGRCQEMTTVRGVALEFRSEAHREEEADALFSEGHRESRPKFSRGKQEPGLCDGEGKCPKRLCGRSCGGVLSFEPSGLVGSDGTLRWEEITENTLVQAEALLTLGEQENRYCFTFQICLPEKIRRKGFPTM